MSKRQFINSLKKELHHMQEDELKSIIADYEEHFEIGKKEGRTEKELAKSLGSPKRIAKQIMADYHVKKAEDDPGNIARAILATAGLGFLNIVFVLGPFLGLVGILIGLFSAGLAVTVSGIIILAAIFAAPFTNYIVLGGINPVAIIFASIGLITLGSLILIIDCYIAKWFYNLTIRYLKWNIRIIRGRDSR